MLELSHFLCRDLENRFRRVLERDIDQPVRMLLVGLPDEVLQLIFERLTCSHQHDWDLRINGQMIQTVLIAVGLDLPRVQSGRSCGCNWDYAVTIRNSNDRVLMLCSDGAWNSLTESIANTTERLGDPLTTLDRMDNIQREVAREIATRYNFDFRRLSGVLNQIRKEALSLGPGNRANEIWCVLDRLLSFDAGVCSPDAACRALGVPLVGATGNDIRQSYDLLKRLAKFISQSGFNDAFDRMMATNTAQLPEVSESLKELRAHLATRLISPVVFAETPAHYFRTVLPTPGWYELLSVNVIDKILSELELVQQPGQIVLRCTNSIKEISPLRGGVKVVQSSVELEASTKGGTAAPITFQRTLRRGQPNLLDAEGMDPTLCHDLEPPKHGSPIRYSAEAQNLRSGKANVLALDEFEGCGIAFVRDASEVNIPTKAAKEEFWTQHLLLRRSGQTELRIFHSSNVAKCVLDRPDDVLNSQEALPRACVSKFLIDVEDGDEISIQVVGGENEALSELRISVNVEQVTNVSASNFEALVHTHQTGKNSTPIAADSHLTRLELNSYLNSPQSWKPVLACWSSEVPNRLSIDWVGDRFLGDHRPVADPRLEVSPPAALVAARNAIQEHFEKQERCLAEIDLGEAELMEPIGKYIAEYAAWLDQEPAQASWFDVLGIHGAVWSHQANSFVASPEPIIILLSSLHPLRIGWHANAQKKLYESLQDRCVLAGMVTPSQVPDSGVLFLSNGSTHKPRSFVSLASENSHWAVLANVNEFFSDSCARKNVLQRLHELGVGVYGLGSGFSTQLTRNSLNELRRLVPARSTLRVGIVGEEDLSSACGDGVISWAEELYSQRVAHERWRPELEIWNLRGATDPRPEKLAHISEVTSESLRWFRIVGKNQPTSLDLTIVDKLEARSPRAESGLTQSPVGPGCLTRIRIREDYHNATRISESRIASSYEGGEDADVLLQHVIQSYEKLAARDSNRSHLFLVPNQEAIGNRLRDSTFVSATSGDVDSACMIRGTISQGGFLWDYELPSILPGSSGSLGYYLLSKPTQAMRESIEKAASLVAGSAVDVNLIVKEISRRGIPILKRLGSGGSQSRGELGLLLASRLLQDVFRDEPSGNGLPVWKGRCIHLILPVDPFEDLFMRIRTGLPGTSATAQRPDFLVASIRCSTNHEPSKLKLTPVEVKFRESKIGCTKMREALVQAENFGKLLTGLWSDTLPNSIWSICSVAVLGQILDFGFRVYAEHAIHRHNHQEWAVAHQKILEDVLQGKASIEVQSAGRLLVFDNREHTQTTDLDGDSIRDTALISKDDAAALLAGQVDELSEQCRSAVELLNFSFSDCEDEALTAGSSEVVQTDVDTRSAKQSQEPNASQIISSFSTARKESEAHEADASIDAPSDTDSVGQGRRRATIPAVIREKVRSAFNQFVGNASAVARLSNDVLRALIEVPPHLAKNYLLTGLPSTGKTELARRLSRALELPFVKLDGRGVTSRDKLFQLVNGELNSHDLEPTETGQQLGLPVLEYPALVIFIDEVHLMPRALQESLLTMLESADRTVVLNDHVAKVSKATFLFATTRASDVDAAFVSRCDEVALREYLNKEVATILRNKFLDNKWTEDTLEALARLGRCVPRVAIQLAEALETAILVAEEDKSVRDHLEDVRKLREIDDLGLTRMDEEYLDILERATGSVGEQNILNMMRTVDKDRVLNDVEPFLVRLSFIKHGPRGRELTQLGREYILSSRVEKGQIE